jgi:hypothetical protein
LRFDVNPGPGRYYAVELAADSDLFQPGSTDNRSATNFYGSWSDSPLMQGGSYAMPGPIRQNLSGSSRLYYRILSSSSGSDWQDLRCSSPDNGGQAIPSIQING